MSRLLTALLLALTVALPACPGPERTPLPSGLPPEYEPPRQYTPDHNIDGPGGDPQKPPGEPKKPTSSGFEDDDDAPEGPPPGSGEGSTDPAAPEPEPEP